MNTAYKFFDDFSQRGINVIVARTIARIFVDYECLAIVLYHLLDNAKKYALANRDITIDFEQNALALNIFMRMISVKLEPDEVPNVYKTGFKGRHTQNLGRKGGGLGMGVLKEIVDKTSIGFSANWGTAVEVMDGQTPYAKNEFILSLPLVVKSSRPS
jgi:K+-sensing histidine kinase KdpD